jgi:hypothetical protein
MACSSKQDAERRKKMECKVPSRQVLAHAPLALRLLAGHSMRRVKKFPLSFRCHPSEKRLPKRRGQFMISRTVSWLTIAMLLGPMFVEAGITKITITNRATAFSGYDWAIQPKRSPGAEQRGKVPRGKSRYALSFYIPKPIKLERGRSKP